jgi:hypothetical protein
MLFMQNSCNMPTIQIRDLPQNLYDDIKNSAEESRRSMTQEVISIIKYYMDEKKKETENIKRKQKALKDLDKIRPLFHGTTKEEMVAMIRKDRER